jgi:hypothetical protein
MANSSLNVSSLDFDTLKANFVTFLKSQPTFQDYNFEGSNINVLLDVMSYNTYLNSFYLNMIASEMFLDSAQKLDSVVSHAKELNYIPRSTRSAKAVIKFDIDTQYVENPLIIQKGIVFTGTSSNGSYTFVTDKETSYISSSNTYSVVDLEIYEGYYNNDVFVVDNSQETQQFIISNSKVDTSSIQVTVSEDSGLSNNVYTFAENLYNLNSNSKVYFLQASANQSYQVLFGDNIFGYTPINGSIVYINYRVSSGSDGNFIGIDDKKNTTSSFQLTQDIGPYNNGRVFPQTIDVVSYSIGGANSESLESIRYNAPRHYQTQNRCVTSQDYMSTVLQNFPEVEYVNVYTGGVTNTSVDYGKVYISPSTYSGISLTDSRKNDIEAYLKERSPVGIAVKIINPEYLYISLDSTIYVNFKNTSSSPSTIISKCITAAKNYNVDNLQNFNTAFRMSKFEQTINDSDIGVLSNETIAKLFRTYNPTIENNSLNFEFYNQIKPGSLETTSFVADGKNYSLTDYIKGVDSGSGSVYMLELNSSLTLPNYSKVGNIDYLSGVVSVSKLPYTYINSSTDTGLVRMFVSPLKQDIYCKDNSIIEIDTISGLNFKTVSDK